MIGIDTNLLVRFLTRDDPAQVAAVDRLFARLSEAAPGFIAREVMVEIVWVLERAYGFARPDVARAIDALLEARELVIEAADRVALAAERYRQGGAGFADQMILLAGRDAGCKSTFTLDRRASQAPEARLLEGGTD